MSPELARSIQIFRELGWQDAPFEDLTSLPLGTPAQRKEALAGVRTGAWGRFGDIGSGRFGWMSTVDGDDARLAAFAIRLGVNPRRAIAVLTFAHALRGDALAALVAIRGPAFAAEFIRLASTAKFRPLSRSTSIYGEVTVRLVHELDLEVPLSVEYLKDWSVFACACFESSVQLFGSSEMLDVDVIRSRFLEHVRAGVELAQPATPFFGEAFNAGVDAGWIPRDEGLDLAFTGLETAQRPVDRAAWLGTIDRTLDVSDVVLARRSTALVPTLASGDAGIIESLAPRLLGFADDVLFVDIAAAALTARTTKARLVVLDALLGREFPRAEGVEDLIEQLRSLAAGRNGAVAKAVERVFTAWGVSGPSEQGPPALRGAWRSTPDVWEPPRVKPALETHAALAACAGRLMGKPEQVHDIETEVFLDLLVRMAYADLDGARSALRGVKPHGTGGLYFLSDWVDGDLDHVRYSTAGLLLAREHDLLAACGRIPSLLSSPSWVDMRIDPEDIVTRLRAYERVGAEVLASDLVLAMTRLDLRLLTDAQAASLARIDVKVLGGDGQRLARSAGLAVLDYVDDPFIEPPVTRRTAADAWRAENLRIPASLSAYPDRFPQGIDHPAWSWHDGVVFPMWAQSSGGGMESYPLPERGLVLRQAARRSSPFGPAVAVRFLGALRQLHPRAAEDAHTAMVEAFERGLLRPEAIDARFLDAKDLASLASACLALADEGLTSVVWPLLDGMIAVSLEAPRMLAGTADLVEAIAELRPAVAAAVEAEIAPADALALPGTRALAERPGSSKAVTAARAVVERLPVEREGLRARAGI